MNFINFKHAYTTGFFLSWELNLQYNVIINHFKKLFKSSSHNLHLQKQRNSLIRTIVIFSLTVLPYFIIATCAYINLNLIAKL